MLTNYGKQEVIKQYLVNSLDFFDSASYLSAENRKSLAYIQMLGFGFESLIKYKYLVDNGYESKSKIPPIHGLTRLMNATGLKDQIITNDKELEALKEYDKPYRSRYPTNITLFVALLTPDTEKTLITLRDKLLTKWGKK